MKLARLLTTLTLLATAASLPTTGASADERLTLDQAIQTALGQSPDLARTQAQAEQAAWAKNEAYSGFLPSLTAGGHWYFLERTPLFHASIGSVAIDSLGPASPWLDAELGLSVPVFDGLRNFDRLRAASLQGHAAELDTDWATFNLRQQVRLAYASVLEAKQLDVVAEQDVKDLQDHRRLIQDQLRAGVTTQVSLLRVETQLSNALSEQTNAENETRIRMRQLAQLMGEEEEKREISGTLPAPTESDLRAIERTKLESRADLEALSLQAEAAENTRRGASKWWMPTLAFVGSYDAYKSQELKLTAYTLGISLKLNLFDGLASYSRSKEAVEAAKIAENTQYSRKLQAQTDFETYRSRYSYNLQRYQARVDDVARAEETLRLARSGFRAGTQTNTDLIDAELDLFNARSGEIQAQYEALQNLISFELAVGRTVTP